MQETARLTSERIEINEELEYELNIKLGYIKENIKNNPEVIIVYFVKDAKKQGGEYIKVTGKVKKIDKYNGILVFTDGRRIPIKEILQIEYKNN